MSGKIQGEKLNGIDDDANGYIDDIHGWNFMGDEKGSLPRYQNYEVVRIVRNNKNFFIKNDSLAQENSEKYLDFTSGKKILEKKRERIKEILTKGAPFIANYYESYDSIKLFFEDKELSLPVLEELLKKQKNLEKEIKAVMLPLQYNMNITDVEKDLEFQKRLLNIYYNPDFDERAEIGDNPNDINDISYGHNLVIGLKEEREHGTYVSGLIATSTKKKIFPHGITTIAKVIPVVVAVNGNAHDKELARGIRYAVDNGASIINISISKEFSLHKEWVF